MVGHIHTPVDALPQRGQHRNERVIPAGIGMADLVLVDDRLGLVLPFIGTHIIHPIVAAALEGPPVWGEQCVGHLRLVLDLLLSSIDMVAAIGPRVGEVLHPAHVDLALPLY